MTSFNGLLPCLRARKASDLRSRQLTSLLWIVPLVGIVVVVAAELIARARLARGGYFVWKPHTKLLLHIDREALPRLPELARFEINAAGERHLRPAPSKGDTGTFRVLTTGGSAVECYFLDQDTQWAGQLEERLNRPEMLQALGAKSAYVGNIGRSGTGPSEAVAKLLDKIAPRYGRLDVIAIMIGAADIVNWMRHGCPVPLQPELETDEIFLQHPEGRFGWSPRQTALFELGRRWKHARETVERHRVGKKLIEVRAMRANAEVVKPATPDPRPMVERYVTWLERAVKRGLQMADRVILIQQPWLRKDWTEEERSQLWNFAEGYPYSETVTTYYSLECASDLMALLAREGGRAAIAAGGETLDVMPHLEPSLDTFYDFIHLTAKGSSDLADVLADLIASPKPTPAREPA